MEMLSVAEGQRILAEHSPAEELMGRPPQTRLQIKIKNDSSIPRFSKSYSRNGIEMTLVHIVRSKHRSNVRLSKQRGGVGRRYSSPFPPDSFKVSHRGCVKGHPGFANSSPVFIDCFRFVYPGAPHPGLSRLWRPTHVRVLQLMPDLALSELEMRCSVDPPSRLPHPNSFNPQLEKNVDTQP